MAEINYNERSLAIDLISDINLWANSKQVSIKKAGGENTIQSNKSSLFPDVLIFGDERMGKILQGWELKMPDTAIDDSELITNAKKKAKLLKLNSFVVWNVTTAVLYKIEDNESLSAVKTWNDLAHIRERADVHQHLDEIRVVLHKILFDLDAFIQSGAISSSSIVDVLDNDQISGLIQRNIGNYAQNLEAEIRTNTSTENTINLWWRSAKYNYPDENNKLIVLARSNLLFLINKFLLAHILKSYNEEAYVVDNFNHETTLHEGLEIFRDLSEHLDFWNVFRTLPFEDKITDAIWDDLISFNDFLRQFKFNLIDRALLHDLISCTIYRNKRKFAGQFTTPQKLAQMLVTLGLSDKAVNVIDPTCGSGTIINEVYKQKKSSLGIEDALKTTWGSDKFELPLQMAMFNMIDPEAMGNVIQVFREDATNLRTGSPIELRDPFSGEEIERSLPEFGLIVANLPFVQQEDLEVLNPQVQNINRFIEEKIGSSDYLLDGRTDLYGYLPFYFWRLLRTDGSLAIIVSNSWLGTKWGEIFYRALEHFYHIEKIVTSGEGRWFENAKVVTNILILKKKEVGLSLTTKTKFVVTKRNIKDYSKSDIDELNAVISLREEVSEEDVSAIAYSKNDIDNLKKLGISLNSLFADNLWLLSFSEQLIKVSELFDIARGERRGWDRLFYPSENSGIEEEFLKPVLKTPRSVNRLIAEPDAEAFCCEKSLQELEQSHKQGALGWIKRFENMTNTDGRPLPVVLDRANTNWYTMEPSTMGEIVTSINFGDRLFFARFNEPTFVNQRLIRFSKKSDGVNIRLCHALMNSTLGLFYIEAMGTGRGEGALDLSKDKIEQDFRIIDPNLYNENQVRNILNKFEALEARDILSIDQELELSDRLDLDRAILEPLDLFGYEDSIRKSLISLFNIRNSVNR